MYLAMNNINVSKQTGLNFPEYYKPCIKSEVWHSEWVIHYRYLLYYTVASNTVLVYYYANA